MGILSSLKGGANLASPKLSAGWIIGAIIAAFLLVGIVLIALFGWGKIQTAVPATSAVMAPVRSYMA